MGWVWKDGRKWVGQRGEREGKGKAEVRKGERERLGRLEGHGEERREERGVGGERRERARGHFYA